MLLTEFIYNEQVYRVSNEYVALDHMWDGLIANLRAPQLATEKLYGGYAKMKFGSISFLPDFFSFKWPPPEVAMIRCFKASLVETDAQLLFAGVSRLRKFNDSSVSYDILGGDYTNLIPAGTEFTGTLQDTLSWACDPSRLNLTLNGSAGRTPSPEVIYTTSKDTLLINLVSDLCAFYCHLFYIENGVLHLVDNLKSNGSRSLTGYDFFPSSYEYSMPTSEIRSEGVSTFSGIVSEKVVRQTAYHTDPAKITTAHTDILSILNSPGCSLKIPLDNNTPALGERISFTDTRMYQNTDIWIKVRSILFDFQNEEATIKGEGGIS